jgi:hypothetical protein
VWIEIVLVSTGELATAATHNTQVLGNLNELRQGGIAIDDQQAGDFITASSDTQLSRMGSAAVKIFCEVFSA